MNGYLVVLSHTMDDIPVFLSASREEAVAFAESCEEHDEAVEKMLCIDCSTPCCVKLIEFSNGRPVAVEIIKEFSESPA